MDLHLIVSEIKRVARDLDKTPTIIEFIKLTDVSKRQINKHGWNNLCQMAGLTPNSNSQQKKPVNIEIRPPKIFCFDIETAPILANVWQLWDNNVSLNQIERDWSILSWAGKFIDEDEVHYADVRKKKDLSDDKEICIKLYKLIEKADILLGHNSDRFDIKKINARFIYHGLKPLKAGKTIDTLKIAKRYFKFTSNKLEYLAKYLGCTPKSSHAKFHGFNLWKECMNGNKEAFQEMEDYNIQDIDTTIEVYEKLRSWDDSLNFQAYTQNAQCICGCQKYTLNGFIYTKQGAFQRYRCEDCGKYYTDKSNLISKSTRKDFFK